MRPHRPQPTRLSRPWDSPGKNTGVGCHFLLQCVKVKLLSRVRPSATPWTAALQTPPSMGFSRQEYPIFSYDNVLKFGASLIAQLVKNLPAMQETWVRFLGPENPLEKEMATHSSILAWEIPWTEEPGWLQSIG